VDDRRAELERDARAHHAGPIGVNGPVIVDFSSQLPAAGGTFTTSNTGVSSGIVNAVRYSPSGFYVKRSHHKQRFR
jgi:hypothetical protein